MAIKNIFILSNEPWGDVWYTKQHYAYELAKLNYAVYFLNPVTKWSPRNIFSTRMDVSEVQPNLFSVTYKNNLPVRFFSKFFLNINDLINHRKISKISQQGLSVFWQFDPFRFAYHGNHSKFKFIYHVDDPFMNIPTDANIAKRANLIISTSPKYIKHYQKLNDHVLFIPHGISKEELETEPNIVKLISQKHGTFILLVGTINEDVDLDLLWSLKELKEKILILGRENLQNPQTIQKWNNLIQDKYVEFIGPVHAKQLKNYIAASTLCLNPYKFTLKKAIGTGSPMKILNYLAQHKPIITSIDSEIEALEGSVIYRANNQQEFISLVKLGLTQKLSVNHQMIDEYLHKNMYPYFIEKIFSQLEV